MKCDSKVIVKTKNDARTIQNLCRQLMNMTQKLKMFQIRLWQCVNSNMVTGGKQIDLRHMIKTIMETCENV